MSFIYFKLFYAYSKKKWKRIDSVNRNKLKEIINNKYINQEDKFLNKIIYGQFIISQFFKNWLKFANFLIFNFLYFKRKYRI